MRNGLATTGPPCCISAIVFDRKDAAFFYDIADFFGPCCDGGRRQIARDKYGAALTNALPETGKYLLRRMRPARQNPDIVDQERTIRH